MKAFAVVCLLVSAVSVMGLVAAPAGAVTWLTVNGQTGGTITMPGWLVMRCDTSAVGATVRFVVGSDLNGNGHLDMGEPITVHLTAVRDGGWTDEDPATKIVQFSDYADMGARGPMVMAAIDDDGSTVGLVGSADYIHPAQSISGTVRYDDGSPAEGLIVTTYVGGMGGPPVASFTDAAGNYTLYLPAGLQHLGVITEFAGWGLPTHRKRGVPLLAWVNLAPGEAKTNQNFTLHVVPGPDIEGTVTEGDSGSPVPGILVGAENNSTGEFAEAYTDITGHYTLQVFPGTWQVMTGIEGDAGPYGNPMPATVVVGDLDVTQDLSLPRLSNRIYGIVTGPGGISIPGADAEARRTSDEAFFWSRCNAQGHYEMWVPAGSYYVGGHDDVGRNYAMPGSALQVTLPPDRRADFSLVARPYILSGRVTFQGTSTGVPYARIHLDDVLYQYSDWFDTRSDGEGNYSIKMPSGSFDVYSKSGMYEASTAPTRISFPPTQTLNFSLTPTHYAPTATAGGVAPSTGAVVGQLLTFSVTYTSADNTAPAAVYVVIDSWPRPMDPVNPGDNNYVDGAVFRYQTTPPAGTHSFWFGVLDQNMLDARIPASPSTMSVTVVASGRLAGQVLLRGTTTPIASAQVKAYLGATLMGSATTGANGVYQISQGLPAGSYVVSAGKDGYVTQVKSGVSVTSGVTTFVNFGLVASGTLTGQVVDKANSTALAGATVNVFVGSVLTATATTGSNGVYLINRDLPTGSSYVVTASKTGYVPQTKGPVTVTAGQTTFLNFFLNKISLTGQVRQAGTGMNLAGATVAAYLGSATTPSGTGTTDANGIYQIGGLTTGTYTVIASKSGYVEQTKPGISFTTGAVTYVNFNLAVSGKLMGQVWDKVGGQPIIGATVSARTGGVVVATGTTVGPYGIYQITSDLPAGTYTMLCTATGYQDFGRIGIVVTAGNTTYVNFSLQPFITMADYFPLSVGDESFMRNVATGTLTRFVVTGTTTIDGSSALVLQQQTQTGTPFQEDYFIVGTQGLKSFGVKAFGDGDTWNARYDPPIIYQNGQIGSENGGTVTRYNWGGTVQGTETYRVRLLGLEDVSVLAGSFPRCLRLEIHEERSPGDTTTQTVWAAPAVGMVKIYSANQTSGYTNLAELAYAKVAGHEYGTHP